VLRRRPKGGSGSSADQTWTGAAELNYIEMSFARVPIFKACSRAELIRVARVTRIREYQTGANIIEEGAKGRDFFVVLDGEARVTRGGQEVATLHSGDFFGELALFDPAPRNATVTAVGKVRVAVSVLAGMARRLHELDSREL
jgi:CRP-like cAMP-binding protein